MSQQTHHTERLSPRLCHSLVMPPFHPVPPGSFPLVGTRRTTTDVKSMLISGADGPCCRCSRAWGSSTPSSSHVLAQCVDNRVRVFQRPARRAVGRLPPRNGLGLYDLPPRMFRAAPRLSVRQSEDRNGRTWGRMRQRLSASKSISTFLLYDRRFLPREGHCCRDSLAI